MKKGADIPMFVVWLIIALVIAIISIYAVTSGFLKFGKVAGASCSAKEGECIDPASQSCPEGKPIKIITDDCGAKDSRKCCVSLTG